MEFSQIRYFLALSRTLNFTRAAEACNVTQPALTRAIQRLEEELGGTLIVRERSLTHLTEFGRAVLPRLEEAYLAAEAAKAEAAAYRKRDAAHLRLGLEAGISLQPLAPVLAEVSNRFGAFDPTLVQAGGAELVETLLDGALDAAFMVESDRIHERLDRWVLFSEDYVVLASGAHAFAAMNGVPVALLANERVLCLSGHECDVARYIRRLSGAIGARIDPKPSGTTTDHLHHLVAAGLGVTLAGTRQPVPQGLVARPLIEPPGTRRLMLTVVAGRPHAPGLAAFVKLARARNWGTGEIAS
jgi:DNA-binding transcriptional LysR family regulator